MCGIIGIISDKPVAAPIFDGLKRLEYRGYDSAGIATLIDGQLQRRRAEGKLEALARELEAAPLAGCIGIGHTRWATHGPAVKANAHPHQSEKVAVVHNGIIENYRDLKQKLVAGGAEFTSDTDTEVIAHLFSYNLKANENVMKAAAATFVALEGTFAIALIVEGLEDRMIIARNGSPLALGYGSGEMFIGSDAFALAPFTNRITYLEDGDWAVVSHSGAEIFDADGSGVTRELVVVDTASAMVDKGNYRHFMSKEIHEQPEVLSRTFGQYADPEKRCVTLPENDVDLASVKRVILVACGTAYFAGLVGKNWIERYAGIPASVDIASEFRYSEAPLDPECLAIFISQSGETADTLAALNHCKANGLRTMGIVNVPDSSITREVDVTLPTYAGPEIGVASTKAFTAQLGALAAFAISLGRAQQTLGADEEARLVDLLLSTPRLSNSVLDDCEAEIEGLAKQISTASSALFIGRATMYPLALEGALKLKEISYIHAEGFAAGELKHGSIALVDENMPVIVIAPDDTLFEKTVSNMQEVMARSGNVILFASQNGVAAAGEGCMATIALPEIDAFIAPVLYALPLQLLAYHAAVAKGTDVDQPRNLAKSVTVE